MLLKCQAETNTHAGYCESPGTPHVRAILSAVVVSFIFSSCSHVWVLAIRSICIKERCEGWVDFGQEGKAFKQEKRMFSQKQESSRVYQGRGAGFGSIHNAKGSVRVWNVKLHQWPLCLPIGNRKPRHSGLSKERLFFISKSLEIGSCLHWFSSQGLHGQCLCILALLYDFQIS